MLVDYLLGECAKLPHTTLSRTEYSRALHWSDGTDSGSCVFFRLFTGVTLGYTFARMPSWPTPPLEPRLLRRNVLVISYCVSGRCRIALSGRDPIYLNNSEVAIVRQLSSNEYVYPTHTYEGIELILDLDGLGRDADILKKMFGLDLSQLADTFCPDGVPYVSPSLEKEKQLMELLLSLYRMDPPYSVYQMKICVLSALSMLMHRPNTPASRQGSFLTEGQILIARQTRELMCADLARHYTGQELAERFGVSESSLKHYFRSVFGKNFSTYIREFRMNHAAALLTETDMSVSAIANQLGYLHQGKFSDAFKKLYGVSPMEYRRLDVLKKHID